MFIIAAWLIATALTQGDGSEAGPRTHTIVLRGGDREGTPEQFGRLLIEIDSDRSSQTLDLGGDRWSSPTSDEPRTAGQTSPGGSNGGGGGGGGSGTAGGSGGDTGEEQDDSTDESATDGNDPPGDPAGRRVTPPPTPRPLLYNWVPDGTPMAVLREMNAQPFVIVYQDILPESDRAVGIADPDIVVTHLERGLGSSFTGWGVIDFENQFFTNLALDPGDPAHERTVDSLIATLQAIRARWPESKWTVWGVPDIHFWIHESGEQPLNWATADFDRTHRIGESVVASHRRLIDHLDWISPWVYDLYAFDASTGVAQRNRVESQIAWGRAKIQLSRQLVDARTGGPIPLIPMLCPSFAPGGDAVIPSIVPMEEFRQECLRPIVPMGVDGLALWTQYGFRMNQAFRVPENGHQQQLRDASRQWLRDLLERAHIAPMPFDHPDGRTWWNDKIRAILIDRIGLMDQAIRESSP